MILCNKYGGCTFQFWFMSFRCPLHHCKWNLTRTGFHGNTHCGIAFYNLKRIQVISVMNTMLKCLFVPKSKWWQLMWHRKSEECTWKSVFISWKWISYSCIACLSPHTIFLDKDAMFWDEEIQNALRLDLAKTHWQDSFLDRSCLGGNFHMCSWYVIAF